MAYYEHVLIARPEISPQQVDALVEDITKTIKELGGTRRQDRILGPAQSHLSHPQEPQGPLRPDQHRRPAAGGRTSSSGACSINEDVMRFKTIRVEELDEEPSPILARRDRDERRRARREGGRDGEDGDGADFEGGEE